MFRKKIKVVSKDRCYVAFDNKNWEVVREIYSNGKAVYTKAFNGFRYDITEEEWKKLLKFVDEDGKAVKWKVIKPQQEDVEKEYQECFNMSLNYINRALKDNNWLHSDSVYVNLQTSNVVRCRVKKDIMANLENAGWDVSEGCHFDLIIKGKI